MSKKSRKIDHLLQRPGSRNWVVRLQYPNGKATEKSLRTSDYREAVVKAGPIITAHKAALLAARPRFESVWQHEYEPGREHVDSDGGKLLATHKELFHIGRDGAITRTEPNGGSATQATSLPRLGIFVPAIIGPDTGAERLAVATKNGDDVLIETYLKHANITGYYEREARSVWTLYRQLCDKPLKEADRDDGRKLVAHFENEGLKSATIQKKVGWLTAACNLAIREGRLKFNPFSSIVPERDDKVRRLPLDDADMKQVKRNLNRLDKSDQLLVRLLGSTGMRIGEAFEIDGEMRERGARYVIVGHKTEQSLRRVPLPATVLPYLPAKITGPLFSSGRRDPPDAASKLLNRFLDDIGIIDKRKVVHSLRHRAQDRLRAAGCPQDVRWELLGHERKTVAEDYGKGSPVPLLKRWIDKIGF